VELPGLLRLLLGWDASTWTKLERLKLSGKLNTSDMRHAATFSEEEEGILGRMSAENIHVKWTVPPTLSRFRIADTTTLWVPKGCADAYKAAKG
jgi:hypothetical protein